MMCWQLDERDIHDESRIGVNWSDEIESFV